MSDDDDRLAQAQKRVGALLCDKYRVERVLGVGGMATVYAGMHRNGRRVALKLLHPELSMRKDIRARFIREGLAANAVNHPGAVAVIDDDVAEDGAAFLVMERLEGKTLEKIWEECGQRLSMRVVLAVGRELCGVLTAAHRAGIVHRDIKPENLFLTDDGHLKVLDFGLARLHDAARPKDTHTGMVFGTPAFMPPEQASGKTSEIDARTDLWAVGATMFTLVSGKMVHEGETAQHFVMLSATERARSLAAVMPHAPPVLVELIDRALARERDTRWPDAEAMVEAIRKASDALFRAPDINLPVPQEILQAGNARHGRDSPVVHATGSQEQTRRQAVVTPTMPNETVTERTRAVDPLDSSSPPTEPTNRTKPLATGRRHEAGTDLDEARTEVRAPVGVLEAERRRESDRDGWSDLRHAIEESPSDHDDARGEYDGDLVQETKRLPRPTETVPARHFAATDGGVARQRPRAPEDHWRDRAVEASAPRLPAPIRPSARRIPLMLGAALLALGPLAIVFLRNDPASRVRPQPSTAVLAEPTLPAVKASAFAMPVPNAPSELNAVDPPAVAATEIPTTTRSVPRPLTTPAPRPTTQASVPHGRCAQKFDLDDAGIKHWRSDCL